MTRLRELRLHGFKTFADPTRLVFDRGVTAVIGPNGSGKSNMADAVRWVLGEQSNRSLRTRRADDVIFAGSEGRRPQGMAEVNITLDNRDGWLPIDFAEVSIGRRAYRSGESEYLINGARARLKEVVELLAAGRLGANELVVVGQGTVDAALSLRPEERRQLFEEAAGVKNLQVRKNEALGRLARARDNLTRVADLMSELKPQVRRLALQAKHQEEHDALGRRAHALAIESHRRRDAQARASLGEARRRMAAAEAELAALRAEEAAGRDEIAQAERRFWSAEATARAAADQRDASREAVIRLETQLDALEGRVADLEGAITRHETELAEDAPARETEASRVDAGGRSAADPLEAERAWRAAVATLDSIEAEAGAAEAALSAARAAAASQQAQSARLSEAESRAVARRDQVTAELDDANGAIAALEARRAEAERELTAALEADRKADADLQDTTAEAGRAIDLAAEQRARASVLAERIGVLRAEHDLLHERADGEGRLGPILAAAGWQVLVEAIDPPREAWAAIETLVGGELQQALVWRDDGVVDHAAGARGLVRLLAEAGSPDDGRSPERKAALEAVGGTRTLAEWIGSGRLPRLFARTAVAPDLDSLLNGWSRLPAGWSAVTAEGDLADERGLVVIRGREEAAGDEAARRHARRRELADALAGLEVEQAEASTAAAQALVAATAARRAQESAVERRAEAQRRSLAAIGARDAAAEALRRGQDLVASLSAELARAGVPAPTTSVKAGTPSEDLDQLAATAAAFRARHAAAAADLARTLAAWQSARSDTGQLDATDSRALINAAVAASRREQLAAAVAADRVALSVLRGELDAVAGALAEARNADDSAAVARATADAERDRLRDELQAREASRGGAATRVVELERTVQAAALEVQRFDDELIAIARERDLALDSLPVEAAQAAADDPGVAELATIAPEAIDAELVRVRRTLAQIGSVNPFAIEEHRELAGRLDALAGQDGDLSTAIASTEELIARLDAEIAGQFNAAFVAIGAKFDEFCRLLFAGGSASLEVSDGEDGGSPGGIEIAVRPPGKRLQRLAMLSGGERALAGVALLFAMLSVNPLPFCILDEVDAALDEANIGRFADALRQLAEQIDFVVITHNRATIEVADTIYGVTMTEAAVTRLLSLRLADIPAEVSAG